MQLLGCFGCHCGCSGLLPGCCYAVTRVFRVADRALLCDRYILSGCQGVSAVTKMFWSVAGLLPGCCYAVTRMF